MDEQKQDEELQEEVAEIESASEEQAEKIEPVIEETTAEPVEQHEPVEAAPVEEAVENEIPKRLEAQPRQIGAPIPGKLERLKAFIMECKRVLRVTKKPDKQEFTTIVKISAIGMAIIGVVGFLVHFVRELLF